MIKKHLGSIFRNSYSIFLTAIILSACTESQDSATLSEEDEPATPPSNVSGSYLDMDCSEKAGSIFCLVRQPGYVIPVFDQSIFGTTPPDMEIYLVPELNANMMEYTKQEKLISRISKDSTSEWGFNVSLTDPTYLNELAKFLVENEDNQNMGLVFTLDNFQYSPSGGSEARKYAVLDRCLLGFFLNEWINPNDVDGDKQVTAVPVEISVALGLGAFAEKLFDKSCSDRVDESLKNPDKKPLMDTFNLQFGALFEDYLRLKGVSREEIEALRIKINDL